MGKDLFDLPCDIREDLEQIRVNIPSSWNLNTKEGEVLAGKMRDLWIDYTNKLLGVRK